MMKAPGSLSFSSAMAAGENGRPQSQHGKSQCAIQNQQVWVGTGLHGLAARHHNVTIPPAHLDGGLKWVCGQAGTHFPPASTALVWASQTIPTQTSSRATKHWRAGRDQGPNAGTLPLKTPCPFLVLPS